MNTATTNKSIHAAERLLCGCYADPDSGARFITCQTHAQAPRGEPLPRKNGMRAMCPYCASQRIVPLQGTAVGTHFCVDCHCQFLDSEISYGLSVDSKPTQCPACNTTYFGSCTCHQQEVAR